MLSAYLRLLRLPNLLIIILTQYLVRFFIINPLLKIGNISLSLSGFHFFLLVLSTVLIAAGGYAINDYFDLRVDRINKPEKMVLGKIIPRRNAILIHSVFSFIGILISFYVALKAGNTLLGLANLFAATMLWFYSLILQRKFLTGNIIIAFLSALVIAVVWLFEPARILSGNTVINDKIDFYVWGYIFFAFFISLIREIVKDIEDIDGDRKVSYRTLPIISGMKNTKIVICLLISLVFLAILLAQINIPYFGQMIIIIQTYITLFIQIPLLYLIYRVCKSKAKSDYKTISTILKLIMLTGILSMSIVYLPKV